MFLAAALPTTTHMLWHQESCGRWSVSVSDTLHTTHEAVYEEDMCLQRLDLDTLLGSSEVLQPQVEQGRVRLDVGALSTLLQQRFREQEEDTRRCRACLKIMPALDSSDV